MATLRVKVSGKQRRELDAIAGNARVAAGVVRRARVILLTAQGVAGKKIAEQLNVSAEAVSRIRRRFCNGAVKGLEEKAKAGRKDHAVPAAIEAQIVQLAMSPPPAGRSRWTTRLLGREVGLANSCISRILHRHELKPHLARTYKVSRDPKFVEKVEDVVGLYLDPPRNAIVLSLDEKTSIQALSRTQPPLPLRTGRSSRHTHDYKRHGVIDLYAALEIATGKVTHRLSESYTSKDFLTFMNKVARAYPDQSLHVVLDNSSSHSTPAVKEWLATHPRVTFHYTPTSASWLNQVEGFFGILGKQSLRQTDFPSKKALRQHIRAYLRDWNRHPTPFAWTKPAQAIIASRHRMLERISRTMH